MSSQSIWNVAWALTKLDRTNDASGRSFFTKAMASLIASPFQFSPQAISNLCYSVSWLSSRTGAGTAEDFRLSFSRSCGEPVSSARVWIQMVGSLRRPCCNSTTFPARRCSTWSGSTYQKIGRELGLCRSWRPWLDNPSGLEYSSCCESNWVAVWTLATGDRENVISDSE